MCNRQVTSVVNLDNAITYICKKKFELLETLSIVSSQSSNNSISF